MAGHHPYHLIPVTVALTSLLAADDIARVVIPGSETITIHKVNASCRALTSGTATVVIKNNAGTTLASIAMTAAGAYEANPDVTTIAGGDKLRFGMSGVGVGLTDVAVTVWLKMPSIA